MLTPQEFASRIKAKYPDYRNADDAELTKRILDKYPDYREQVTLEAEIIPPAVPAAKSTGQPYDPFAGMVTSSPALKGYFDALRDRNTPSSARPQPQGNSLFGLGLPEGNDWKENLLNFANAPSIRFSQLAPHVDPQHYPILAAIQAPGRGLLNVAEGLTTPLNAGLLALTGGLGRAFPMAARAASAGFAGTMGHGTVESMSTFNNARQRGDVPEMLRIGTEMIAQGVFTGAALKHAILGVPKPMVKERPAVPEDMAWYSQLALNQDTIPPARRLTLNSETGQFPIQGTDFTMKPGASPLELLRAKRYSDIAASAQADQTSSVRNALMSLAGNRPMLPAPETTYGPGFSARIASTPEQMIRARLMAAINQGVEQGFTQNALGLLAERPLGLPMPRQASGAIPLAGPPDGAGSPPPGPASLAPLLSDTLTFGDRVRQKETSLGGYARNAIRALTGKSIADFENEMSQKKIKAIIDESPKGGGLQAVIAPSEAFRLLATEARNSKTFEEFRRAVADNKDLLDAVKFYNMKLRTIYENPEGESKQFKGFRDVTTPVIDALKGREKVSRQFVEDTIRQQGMKKADIEAAQRVLREYPAGQEIPVKEFAAKLKSETLPLDSSKVWGQRYKYVGLPKDLRGDAKNYQEVIYQSPIKTGAGRVHFPENFDETTPENYFAHTRTEDMPAKVTSTRAAPKLTFREVKEPGVISPKYEILDANGKVVDTTYSKNNAETRTMGVWRRTATEERIRRIIEIQSDLFQKGRLEMERNATTSLADLRKRLAEGQTPEDAVDELNLNAGNVQHLEASRATTDISIRAEWEAAIEAAKKVPSKRASEVSLLEHFKNDWGKRIIREEIKRAAKDKKNIIQIPVGQTAMKIEGLETSSGSQWTMAGTPAGATTPIGVMITRANLETIKPGTELRNVHSGENWVMVGALPEEGRMALVSADYFNRAMRENNFEIAKTGGEKMDRHGLAERLFADDENIEHFTLGEQDTQNPIYKFYESTIPEFLKKIAPDTHRITDDKGVEWWQFKVPAEARTAPVRNLGMVVLPTEAARILWETARDSQSYADFRRTIAENKDLKDTVRFYNIQLRQVYDNRNDQKAVERVVGGEKSRGFVETVRGSPNTAPDVREGVSGTYEPITNAETFEQAANIIAKDPERANRLAKSNAPASALSNTIAQVLIDTAQKTGRYEDAIDLVEITAQRATRQGQAIQALSIYNKLTPVGIVRFAQRLIDQANIKKPGLNLKLTSEATQKLTQLADQIQKMPEGQNKIIATAKLLKTAREQVPPDIWEKISAIQTMAQLLNPKTLIRNLGGNLGFAALEQLSDIAAVPVDVLTSMITGKRTKDFPSLTTQFQAGKEGMKAGTRDALLGIDTGNQTTQFDLPRREIFSNPFLKTAGRAMNLALRAPDRAFYQAAYAESIRQQMTAAKATAPTETMQEQAHLDGLYRTFQDDSVSARIFVGLKRALNVNQKFGLGDAVLKYPKTPGNLLARGLDYSPAGFIKSVFELARPYFGNNEFRQKKFVEDTSRATVGSTTLVATGAILHQIGIITGRRDKDRDMAQFRRETGLGEYRLNLSALRRFVMGGFDASLGKPRDGDNIINYDWMQPAAIGLSIGANINENRGLDPQSGLGAIAVSVMNGADTLAELPLLTGVRRMFGGYGSPSDTIANVIKGVPASFVPTLLNQVRQLTDNVSRDTKNKGGFFEEMGNMVRSRIPGASKGLPPRVGVFGDDQEIFKNGKNNLFNVFLNPAFKENYISSPEAQMVMDIYEKTGLTSQAPRVVGRNVTIDGLKRKLEPDEYVDLQRYVGKRTKEEFARLAKSPFFKTLAPEEQAKKLGTLLTNIGSEAKMEVLADAPKTGDGRRRLLNEIAKENMLDFMTERSPENKRAFIESWRKVSPEARARILTQARQEYRDRLRKDREKAIP